MPYTKFLTVPHQATLALRFRSLATVAEQGWGGIGMPRSFIVRGTRPRRRELLALAGLAAAATLAGRPGRLSAAGHDHPKTDLTPDQALERLRAGNARFVADPEVCTTDLAGRRRAVAAEQAPWATVVACADSRVPPELLFGGLGLGELFVARNAGNLADQATLGTVEYGAAVLGSPLIVVLGHTRCGAVEAACDVVTEHATFPGAIGPMVEPIVPAALAVRDRPRPPAPPPLVGPGRAAPRPPAAPRGG